MPNMRDRATPRPMIDRLKPMKSSFVCVGWFLLTGAALAADGDPVAGKRRADLCNACHSQAGLTSVPNLGGQNPLYLLAALRAYQEGTRAHATMREVVKAFSDREFKNFAAYYADQPVNEEPNNVDVPAAAQSCLTCHDTGGALPRSGEVPRIRGQKKGYLDQVLREYRAGQRKHEVMQPLAEPLSDEDIAALAAFFSAQKGVSVK